MFRSIGFSFNARVCLILLISLTTISNAAVLREFKQYYDLTFVAPIELRDSPTSITELLQRFQGLSGLNQTDINAFKSALQRDNLPEVHSWLNERKQQIVTSRSEILRIIVAQAVLHEYPPGPNPRLIVDQEFYSNAANLCRSITNFDNSGAGQLARSLPPDILALCTDVLRGKTLPQSDVEKVSRCRLKLISGNFRENATAINLCNLVLLDQSLNAKQLFDLNTTMPVAMPLHLVIQTDSLAFSNIIKEHLLSGVESGQLDFNLMITMLYSWDNEITVQEIVHELLHKHSYISPMQRAELYWLIRNSDDIITKKLKEVELLQHKALFPEEH